MALRKAVRENAAEFARALAPVVAELQSEGVNSLRGIAEALNALGMLTRRGRRWHMSNVRNLLARFAMSAPLS